MFDTVIYAHNLNPLRKCMLQHVQERDREEQWASEQREREERELEEMRERQVWSITMQAYC